jgi:hypothetical protein
MAEAGTIIVERSPKDEAHSWARNVDRLTTRSTGQVKYGDTRVQEIVSSTACHKRTMCECFLSAW